MADMGFIVSPFEEIPVLVTYWGGEEDIGPEINILFDRNIEDIFCTEDIVIMAEMLAHRL